MPGFDTVTVTDDSTQPLLNPGAIAVTTVVPPDSASNATPPPATEVPVYSRPTGISTATEAPADPIFFIWPTGGELLVKVTGSGPAALTGCQNHTPVPAVFNTPA